MGTDRVQRHAPFLEAFFSVLGKRGRPSVSPRRSCAGLLTGARHRFPAEFPHPCRRLALGRLSIRSPILSVLAAFTLWSPAVFTGVEIQESTFAFAYCIGRSTAVLLCVRPSCFFYLGVSEAASRIIVQWRQRRGCLPKGVNPLEYVTIVGFKLTFPDYICSPKRHQADRGVVRIGASTFHEKSTVDVCENVEFVVCVRNCTQRSCPNKTNRPDDLSSAVDQRPLGV